MFLDIMEDNRQEEQWDNKKCNYSGTLSCRLRRPEKGYLLSS